MIRRQADRRKGVLRAAPKGSKLQDPYIPKKGIPEPNVCPVCSAVYHKKHWAFDEDLLFALKKEGRVYSQKCPACRKIEDGYAMGIVDLTGSFVTEHFNDLINTIRSEERHAMEKNPLERIIKLNKIRTGGVRVETTTDSLALRIGRLLYRAYKGDTKFDFRYGDKYVDVKWHRDSQ